MIDYDTIKLQPPEGRAQQVIESPEIWTRLWRCRASTRLDTTRRTWLGPVDLTSHPVVNSNTRHDGPPLRVNLNTFGAGVPISFCRGGVLLDAQDVESDQLHQTRQASHQVSGYIQGLNPTTVDTHVWGDPNGYYIYIQQIVRGTFRGPSPVLHESGDSWIARDRPLAGVIPYLFRGTGFPPGSNEACWFLPASTSQHVLHNTIWCASHVTQLRDHTQLDWA